MAQLIIDIPDAIVSDLAILGAKGVFDVLDPGEGTPVATYLLAARILDDEILTDPEYLVLATEVAKQETKAHLLSLQGDEAREEIMTDILNPAVTW